MHLRHNTIRPISMADLRSTNRLGKQRSETTSDLSAIMALQLFLMMLLRLPVPLTVYHLQEHMAV